MSQNNESEELRKSLQLASSIHNRHLHHYHEILEEGDCCAFCGEYHSPGTRVRAVDHPTKKDYFLTLCSGNDSCLNGHKIKELEQYKCSNLGSELFEPTNSTSDFYLLAGYYRERNPDAAAAN